MITRSPLAKILVLGALLLVTFAARAVLLGGSSVIKLGPAPSLSGAISQSLAASGTNSSLSTEGKDYVLSKVTYFDNGTWAVATVGSVNKTTDPATLVLEKISGVYRVMLGPGTAFSTNDTESLPGDVVQYLKTSGVLLYTPLSYLYGENYEA